MTANVLNTNIVFSETREYPYHDDYDESKHFHKILFRPGYAVQARELTQLQTILQNQIERFGSHIFKNGSLVHGGQISLDFKATHLNLESTYIGTDIDPSLFVGKTIRWTANNRARAIVVASQDGTADTPPTLAIKYLTGQKFGHGDTIRVDGEEVYANLTSSGSNGRCAIASVDEGIFYINGYFVKNDAQSVVADAYSVEANCKVGLEFAMTIVDENSDSSLLDPARESSNEDAPGATRLAIDLNLNTRDLNSEDDESQFIELMKIEEGVVKKWNKVPVYSDLADTMARRTYDESGSYTVRPFHLSFKNHPTDDTKVIAILAPGKSYVQGYEFETIADTEIVLNRARTTSNINNYDLSTSYGNYFYGANLEGTFDTTVWSLADIHSVPFRFIDRSSQTKYDSTKIASTRVREIAYYTSANALSVADRTYKISIAGTKFNKLQTNVVVGNNSTVTLHNPSNLLSANTDAYLGATLRLTVGSRADAYEISAWNGTTSTATLARPVVVDPTSSSNAIISFDFSAAESLTISSLTAGAPSDRANVNISIASKFPVTQNGDAYLNETDADMLLFPLPQSYIAAGSITDQSFPYRKKFAATFTANVATIAVDSAKEAFMGTTGTTLSTMVLEGFLVIGSTGTIVRLNSVSVDGSQTATLTAENYSGAATVFAYVNLNAGNNTYPKRKSLITGNTTHFVRHSANATLLSGTTNTTVYLVAGQVGIENPSRTQNEQMPLYVSDTRRITAIYDLRGDALPAAGTSLSSYTNVKSYYVHDTGQRDSYYDHATISLSPNAPRVPRGPLIVCFDYYDHGQGQTDDGLGYFSVDSYPNANTTAGYTDIPSYTTTNGRVFELRDCIDFRPRRANASNTTPNFTINGIRIPVMGEEFGLDYSYHLARRDLLQMSSSTSNPFEVIEGIPAKFPVEPQSKNNGMVIYKILMPAYTESFRDVMSQFVENKRYTMRDIGVLEKRLENLEYYNSLSRLEAAASSQVILDEFGLERTKYGILVDDFTGHSTGDVLNLDYKCSVDKVNGALGPAWIRRNFPLEIESKTNTINNEDNAMLDYSEVDLITQPAATRVENVQPFLFADFLGNITISPEVASFVSTNIAPIVLI
jgi:hypothetical protein